MADFERVERLSIDIDTRMFSIWPVLAETFDNEELEIIAPFLRWAYGQGWTDALKEERGKLARDNDYAVPPPLDDSAK